MKLSYLFIVYKVQTRKYKLKLIPYKIYSIDATISLEKHVCTNFTKYAGKRNIFITIQIQ